MLGTCTEKGSIEDVFSVETKMCSRKDDTREVTLSAASCRREAFFCSLMVNKSYRNMESALRSEPIKRMRVQALCKCIVAQGFLVLTLSVVDDFLILISRVVDARHFLVHL